MVDILISNVRVKRTRSGFAIYTYKQHHGISADLLKRKLGIGIDKENWTLQSTTQYNMRSALKQMMRRYRTDSLLHRLHHLNCRFYTEMLFAKYKSIVWNTCAQIFIDGKFVQIIPLRTKLYSGTTLERINRHVGVANEIFMDNAPK